MMPQQALCFDETQNRTAAHEDALADFRCGRLRLRGAEQPYRNLSGALTNIPDRMFCGLIGQPEDRDDFAFVLSSRARQKARETLQNILVHPPHTQDHPTRESLKMCNFYHD